MATKDIPDRLVLKAFKHAPLCGKWPYELLQAWTHEPEKVCYRAMQRAAFRGLVHWGVSLRTGWVTATGEALLSTPYQETP